MKRKLLVVVLVVVALLTVSALVFGAPSPNKDDGTLIVAVPDAPSYMDPQVQASIGTYRVTTQIFDRLVSMDTEMNLVPGLAERPDPGDRDDQYVYL